MYIGLSKYGEYKIFDSEKKMLYEKAKFDYLIFDISSYMKGPLHTVVSSSSVADRLAGIDLVVTFDKSHYLDLPFKNETSYRSENDLSSFTELFSIASMAYQYDALNLYIETLIYSDATDTEGYNIFTVSDIILFTYEKTRDVAYRFHYFYDVPSSSLRNFFEKMNINFCGNRLFEDGYLILYKDNTYEFTDKIPNKFKYIGFPILESESFYLITRKQYRRFMELRDFTVDIVLSDENTDEEEFINSPIVISASPYEMCDLAFFNMILFLPQFVLLSNFMKDEKDLLTCANITIETELHTYSIALSASDIAKGTEFSLFNILDTITKI